MRAQIYRLSCRTIPTEPLRTFSLSLWSENCSCFSPTASVLESNNAELILCANNHTLLLAQPKQCLAEPHITVLACFLQQSNLILAYRLQCHMGTVSCATFHAACQTKNQLKTKLCVFTSKITEIREMIPSHSGLKTYKTKSTGCERSVKELDKKKSIFRLWTVEARLTATKTAVQQGEQSIQDFQSCQF